MLLPSLAISKNFFVPTKFLDPTRYLYKDKSPREKTGDEKKNEQGEKIKDKKK